MIRLYYWFLAQKYTIYFRPSSRLQALQVFGKVESISDLCERQGILHMGYIILGIIALILLWRLGALIVEKVREAIEDRAISKYRIKEDLIDSSNKANERWDSQILQARNAITSFRAFALERLPGLEDRIARHERQQDYVHNVLPYKRNKKRRR